MDTPSTSSAAPPPLPFVRSKRHALSSIQLKGDIPPISEHVPSSPVGDPFYVSEEDDNVPSPTSDDVVSPRDSSDGEGEETVDIPEEQ